MSTASTRLEGVVAEHVAAVNAFDVDRIVATFAPRRRRQRRAPRVLGHRRDPALDHQGDRRRPRHHRRDRGHRPRRPDDRPRPAYDGTYDKANLPDELILTNYFNVRDGKITSLIVIFNQPSDD